MPKRKVYHVTTSDKGGWAVKAEGNSRPSSTHTTKAEAVRAAKAMARKTGLGQVIVHGRNGRIQFEHSYGRTRRERRLSQRTADGRRLLDCTDPEVLD